MTYRDPGEQVRGTRRRKQPAPPPDLFEMMHLPAMTPTPFFMHPLPAPTGDDLAVAGIQQSSERASDRWKALAYECVILCADVLPTFTSDDIWFALEHSRRDVIETERNPSALGGVMRRAVHAGAIEKTGAVRKSLRPSQHSQEIREWRRTESRAAAVGFPPKPSWWTR